MVSDRLFREEIAQDDLNTLSGKVVDAAINVHKNLGPGLFEEVYKQCLMIELEKRQLCYDAEVFQPVIYENRVVDSGYRIDLLIEKRLIVELKAVAEIHPIHKAQLLTYLKLSKVKLGLLINFNVPILPKGIVRMIR